jgi:hypothetical protein
MAKRTDAQARQPGKPSDGQQVVHGLIVKLRVTGESSPLFASAR